MGNNVKEGLLSGTSFRLETLLFRRNALQLQLRTTTTLPVNAQQAGSEYFKTARKCNLFGVCCKPCSFQVNYLIDEVDDVGKGADATVSMEHNFLENHSLGVEKAHFHADNCTAQNINNTNVHYLLWTRVKYCTHGCATFPLGAKTRRLAHKHSDICNEYAIATHGSCGRLNAKNGVCASIYTLILTISRSSVMNTSTVVHHVLHARRFAMKPLYKI